MGELEFEPLSFESKDVLFIMPPPTVNLGGVKQEKLYGTIKRSLGKKL